MEKIINPKREEWSTLLVRPQYENKDIIKICKDIFSEIKRNGDKAVQKYTWFFDKVRLEDFAVSQQEFKEAEQFVGEELKTAIRKAKKNIEAFHRLQWPCPCEYINENGFRCWQEIRAIEKVGLYIPGGSAPLFSTVLMLAIPAKIAGCKEIVMCTPPDKSGKVDPAILWSAQLCGVTKVFKVGGVQAIGAMTFGTETIPSVYKIFGPGNQFVTIAKQLACSYGIAIDMPAGPSEVMIVADKSAYPAFIAADLLSQAEHGPDSQVTLITFEEAIVEAVEIEIELQLQQLPRKEIINHSLNNSKFIVVKDMNECLSLVNMYAPEHLILCVDNYQELIPQIINAGSVFLGNYSPESAGDYASGTNHTLPTNGYAKAYSGINIDAFIKKIPFQEISSQGLKYLGRTIMEMAINERLEAHSKAVEKRCDIL